MVLTRVLTPAPTRGDPARHPFARRVAKRDGHPRQNPSPAAHADRAPCTTTIRGLPSELPLDPSDDPIPRPSAMNLDSVESVVLGTLVERLGRLSDLRMRQIRAALEVAVGCEG
jgi:mRNA interferase MazF